MPDVNQTASVAQLIATSLVDHLVNEKEALEIVDKVKEDGKVDCDEQTAVYRFTDQIMPYYDDDGSYAPRPNYFESGRQALRVWIILNNVDLYSKCT